MPTPVPDIDPQPLTVTFPMTAWEQIAVVCVFALIMFFLMRYMFSHFKDITNSVTTMTERFLVALERRDNAFESRNGLIATKLEQLNSTMIEHDAKMDQALDDMRAAKARANRRKAGDEPKSTPRSNE